MKKVILYVRYKLWYELSCRFEIHKKTIKGSIFQNNISMAKSAEK